MAVESHWSSFRLSNEIAIDARDYIIENFSIDLSDYDVVIGYRADDTYFSFDNLKFEEVELADKTIYYPKFISRDFGAREINQNEIRKSRSYKDDIFVLDILREEMKNDDSRIQRILSE